MNGKKTGRPRGFDERTALNSAMNVFWAKGYHGASMADLTEAMGINRPSLYATFGDKKQLYLKAIENYAKNDGSTSLVAFEAESNIEKAVLAFMMTAIDLVTTHESGARGCFLASCVATSAGEVDGVDQVLCQAMRDTEKKLTLRFNAEKEKGTLPIDFPSLERARLMFDMSLGHAYRSRAGVSRNMLIKDLGNQVKCILA